MSGFAPALPSGFSAESSFPNQQGFLPPEHTLHQGSDPNSPAAFQQNLQIVQERVARLQNLARNTLAGILDRLKQEIQELSQLMLQSGVGALPVLPMPGPSDAISPPTEQQLLAEVNNSIRFVFEQVKRSQDSAAVVANLLGAPGRAEK
ncbi:hypothetical protein DXG01_013563 [Tephrocybe rancida]|nr:hypothetical protein DXG01_013563 [Tephrocybe rancida]